MIAQPGCKSLLLNTDWLESQSRRSSIFSTTMKAATLPPKGRGCAHKRLSDARGSPREASTSGSARPETSPKTPFPKRQVTSNGGLIPELPRHFDLLGGDCWTVYRFLTQPKFRFSEFALWAEAGASNGFDLPLRFVPIFGRTDSFVKADVG